MKIFKLDLLNFKWLKIGSFQHNLAQLLVEFRKIQVMRIRVWINSKSRNNFWCFYKSILESGIYWLIVLKNSLHAKS